MIHDKFTAGAHVKKLARGGFVYLASPYTKLAATVGLDEAARSVALAAGALMDEGCVVFSPIAHGHAVASAYGFDKVDQGFWMAQCYPMVSAAAVCAVLKLDGWATSSGVQAEVDMFVKDGKPVVYLDPSEIIPHEKWFAFA